MALFWAGTNLTGGSTDDFIFGHPSFGPNHNLDGGGGDDLIFGDFDNFYTLGGTNVATALDITSNTLPWSTYSNADILNSATVPHTSIYVEPNAGTTVWYAVTVVAGATITLDVDYGSHVIGGSTDTMVRIVDTDGVTQLAVNDDSSITTGGLGSTGSFDSFLQYTFAAAGTYYIEIGEFSAFDTFDGGETFILNVSLTGQAVTNSDPVNGNDTINGGDGNDTIHGGGGLDTINGGANNDTIVDSQNNTVNGDAGNDLIINTFVFGGTWDGGADTDTLDTSQDFFNGATYDLSAASFVIFGATFLNFENVIDNDGGNTIIGTNGVNVLRPNGGADTVDARGGNDTIFDTDGVNGDNYNGGADTDTLNYSGATMANGTEYNFLTGTVSSGAFTEAISNIEILIATSADEIIRSDGTGEYYAESGNDIVYAGLGLPETLDGGGGTDTLITTSFTGNYVVNLATGLTNFLGESFTHFENLITGSGIDTLTGTTGDNVIEGGAGGDTMNGDLGNDTLSYAGSNAGVTVNLATNTASGGHATGDSFSNFENVLGSALVDDLTGSSGVNVLSGGGSGDILRGGDGNDTLNGDGGNDFLYGQNDNDTLNGGEGNDTLDGQSGADTMTGGNGNDTYFLDNAGDVVVEAIGSGVDTTDTVITSVNFRQDLMTSARGVEYITVTGTGNVTIIAMETFNVITGNTGNNYIAGYGGNDTINAGAGIDFVFGGDGRDSLTGGPGDDTFYYSFVADSGGTVNRRDTITDFGQVVGNNDVIDLRPLDAISFNTGLQHFNWIGTEAFSGALGQLRYFYDAGNNLTIIEGNTFGDTTPEFQLALQGNYTLTAGVFGSGADILIA